MIKKKKMLVKAILLGQLDKLVCETLGKVRKYFDSVTRLTPKIALYSLNL